MGLMINRRRVYGGKKGLLPSGYKQVEYIESPNIRGPYIMTNIVLGNHSISARIQQLEYVNDCALFGAWKTSSPASIFQVTYYNGRYYFGCSEQVEQRVLIPKGFNTDWHTYELSPEAFKLDGALVANRSNPYIQNGFSCVIFGRNIDGSNQTSTVSKNNRFSHFSIMDLDTSKNVFNAIPCISPTNEVGMYDLVSQQFFGKSGGTGSFIAGPRIS